MPKYHIVTGPGIIIGKNAKDIAGQDITKICLPPKVSVLICGKFHTNCSYKPYTKVNEMFKLAKKIDGKKTVIVGPPDSGKSFYIEHLSKINNTIVGNIDTMQPIAGHPMTQSITKREKAVLQSENSTETFSPHIKFDKNWMQIAKSVIDKSEILNIPGGGLSEQQIKQITDEFDIVISINNKIKNAINIKNNALRKTIYNRRTYTYWMVLKDNHRRIKLQDKEIQGDNKLKRSPKIYKKRYIGQVVGLFYKKKFKGIGIVENTDSGFEITTYAKNAELAKITPLKILPKQAINVKKSLNKCKPR